MITSETTLFVLWSVISLANLSICPHDVRAGRLDGVAV